MTYGTNGAAALGLLLVLAGATARADVVAWYTFDGRCGPTTRVARPHSAAPPYNGEDYVPDPRAGESGPALENPGPGGENWNYYRSFYNHDASDESRGRQTLELQQHHSFYLGRSRAWTPPRRGDVQGREVDASCARA